MTTFCIVTPVRNGAKYLNMAITHIVSQAGDFHIRYHIQDGGSTDGTLDIIRQWEAMLSAECPIVQCRGVEFSWASEPDNGMYDAINKGFLNLNIREKDCIMAWCNSDDLYIPLAFKNIAKAFNDIQHMRFLAGEWYQHINGMSKQSRYHGSIYPAKIMQQGCCDTHLWTSVAQTSVFWKKSLWDEVGGLDRELKYAGDYDLWRRFSSKDECVFFPLILSIGIYHENQLGIKKQYVNCESTYYELERETICPKQQRINFMKSFWRGHFYPPLGKYIKHDKEKFSIELLSGWPKWWGKNSYDYYRHRILYYIYSFVKQIKNIIR